MQNLGLPFPSTTRTPLKRCQEKRCTCGFGKIAYTTRISAYTLFPVSVQGPQGSGPASRNKGVGREYHSLSLRLEVGVHPGAARARRGAHLPCAPKTGVRQSMGSASGPGAWHLFSGRRQSLQHTSAVRPSNTLFTLFSHSFNTP